MTRMRLIPIVALATVLAAGCQAPPHVGPGDLETMNLPLALDPVHLHGSATEELVLCETDGKFNLFFGDDLLPKRSRHMQWKGFAFARDGKSGVALTEKELVILRMPDLNRMAAIAKPKGAFTGAVDLAALPDGSGYVIVSDDRATPNVWVVKGNPPAFVRSGTSRVREHYRAFAVDDRTGHLLIIDDQHRMEVFDLDTMRTIDEFELPCRQTDFAFAAGGGWAYLGTRDGLLIPIDIESEASAEPIRLGPRGWTRLSLSGPGNLLGVAFQEVTDRRPPYSTKLLVFQVGPDGLTEIARAFFEAPGLLRSAVMMERSGAFVVAFAEDLYAWKWAEED